MSRGRKTLLYFAPHQDDELLSMGIDICTSLKKGHDVHVILCSDGSKSYVRGLLGNGKRCKKHEGIHCYDLSVADFIAARDREFKASCLALGVPESNIHIPAHRAVDGSVYKSSMEKLILEYVSALGSDAVVCTLAPTNGPQQHKDHKTLGWAASGLLKSGRIRKIRFFVEPYLYGQIAENPRLIPVEPEILTATDETAEKIKAAIGAYSLWDPEQQRYAVGYHSVTNEFNDFLNTLQSCSYEEINPETATLTEKLDRQHRKWKKLQKQKQLYYSTETCAPPDLGEMKLVAVQANELASYRNFCESHGIAVTEKNLQRLRDGSSFWCLVSPEDNMVSSGWLAWKQNMYISETDFGFRTDASDAGILYNFETHPDYRGRGLYGQLLRSIVYNAKGPQKYIIYTAPDNNASSRGILKAGFRFDGALNAADGSLKGYLQQHGFTHIRRKYRLFGLWVAE